MMIFEKKIVMRGEWTIPSQDGGLNYSLSCKKWNEEGMEPLDIYL